MNAGFPIIYYTNLLWYRNTVNEIISYKSTVIFFQINLQSWGNPLQQLSIILDPV